MERSRRGINTESVHAGAEPDRLHGAVSVPIYQSSTFAFDSVDQGAARFAGEEGGYIYTRMGNPTVAALEQAVARMEGGWGALATSSGMAAIVNVFFTYLHAGAHLVGTDSVYGPTRTVVETRFRSFGVDSSFVDTSDPAEIRAAIRPNTRMLYVETPENPTLRLTDLEACVEIAREHDLLLVVDNTFATPVLQRPLEVGADVVLHSMTKFLNGHADVVAGIIVPATEERYRELRRALNFHGGCIDPHQAWLVHRGLKTLGLRLTQAQRNAMSVAELLRGHPAVEWVRYPGAADFPQRELVERQMDGPGALLCFGVKGGLDGGRLLMERLRIATLAVSLGGVETLVEHPASMTHAGIPRADREAAGISDNLIRLAVGCEDAEDLIEDLERALETLLVDAPVARGTEAGAG
jgi:methionine-gamma-lyase